MCIYTLYIYIGSIDFPLVCSSPALCPQLSNLHMSGGPSSSSMPTQTSAVAQSLSISENPKTSLESKPNLLILRLLALSKVRNLDLPMNQWIPIRANHSDHLSNLKLMQPSFQVLGARRPQQIWCHHKSARCPGARPPWPIKPAIKKAACLEKLVGVPMILAVKQNHLAKTWNQDPPKERSYSTYVLFCAVLQHLKHHPIDSSILILTNLEAIQLSLSHFDNCRKKIAISTISCPLSGLGLGNLLVFWDQILLEKSRLSSVEKKISWATRCPCAKFGSDIQILPRDPTGTVWLTFPAFQILLFLFFQLEVQPQIYNVVYKTPWLFLSKGVVTCNDILEMVLDFQGVYFGAVRCSFINAEWYHLDASRIPKFKMFQMRLDFNFEELLQGVSPSRSFQSQIGFYASCWLWLYIFTLWN